MERERERRATSGEGSRRFTAGRAPPPPVRVQVRVRICVSVLRQVNQEWLFPSLPLLTLLYSTSEKRSTSASSRVRRRRGLCDFFYLLIFFIIVLPPSTADLQFSSLANVLRGGTEQSRLVQFTFALGLIALQQHGCIIQASAGVQSSKT